MINSWELLKLLFIILNGLAVLSVPIGIIVAIVYAQNGNDLDL